tara:strand:+ start:348 stop:563 length:216 start_codon:yes stop_codon:yes gene_type:complete
MTTVTIDGIEHDIENLSDDQKNVMGHVQVADTEITRMHQLIAVLTTGRQAYINELGQALNKDDDEDFIEDK